MWLKLLLKPRRNHAQKVQILVYNTYDVPITYLGFGILMHKRSTTDIIMFSHACTPRSGFRGPSVFTGLCALLTPIHGGLKTAEFTSMTISDDHAVSKAKATENHAVPPNKKAKKLDSTKPPSKPIKAIKQEAADNNAGAFPDLTNAPTHGPDEPLLLEHGSTREGDSSCAIQVKAWKSVLTESVMFWQQHCQVM